VCAESAAVVGVSPREGATRSARAFVVLLLAEERAPPAASVATSAQVARTNSSLIRSTSPNLCINSLLSGHKAKRKMKPFGSTRALSQSQRRRGAR
jgi:hypothetical protein